MLLTAVRACFALPALSWTHSRLKLVHGSHSELSWTEFLKGWRLSDSEVSGSCVSLSASLSHDLHRVLSHKSEAMVPSQQRVDCPLWFGNKLLLPGRSSRSLAVLVTSDWCGVCSDAVQVCCGEERTKHESKAVNWSIYIPTPSCGHEL